MNWVDGESTVQAHKEFSRKSAAAYLAARSAPRPDRKPTIRLRLLAALGSVMVATGYRLINAQESAAGISSS